MRSRIDVVDKFESTDAFAIHLQNRWILNPVSGLGSIRTGSWHAA
jgi:hypothetical protein